MAPRLRPLLLALVAALTVTGSFVAHGQQPTFRSGTQTVPLYVTVTDPQRRLVAGLAKEDFQVFDNGKLQEISLFDNTVRPVTVVVMLDTSASMTMSLDLVKVAAEQFVIRLLPDDQAKVGAFNDKIEIGSATFTNDRDDLTSQIKNLDYGNATRLWDAVDFSLDELRGVEGRRVVVVFTDGDDTGSKVGLGKVIDRARAEEVMVYAIGIESVMKPAGMREIRTRPDRGLKRLAAETGGGYFELETTDELGATFTRVAQELHSQYLLGFTPPQLDGKIHKVDVKVVTRPDHQARARKSYVATPPKETPTASK
jgi:Ca-activated chloride channel homolog